MKKVYSIAAYSQREAETGFPDVNLSVGNNVFTIVTDNIDELRERLVRIDGVRVDSINCIEPSETTGDDLYRVGDYDERLDDRAGPSRRSQGPDPDSNGGA